jgi:hypothetical protein
MIGFFAAIAMTVTVNEPQDFAPLGVVAGDKVTITIDKVATPAPPLPPEPTPEPAPTPPEAGALSGLTPGTISPVDTANTFASVSPQHVLTAEQWNNIDGWTGHKSVFDAWNDITLNTRTNVIYADAGGGHTDYNGNERYSLTLSTLMWARENMPSVYASWPSGGALPDGRPESRHTYNSFEFIPGQTPELDRYLISGAYAGPNAGPALVWQRGADDWTQIASNDADWSPSIRQIAYDAGTGHAWVKAPLALFEASLTSTGAWDIVKRKSNRWSTGVDYSDSGVTMRVHPIARRIVYIGNNTSRIYNITTAADVLMENNVAWTLNKPSAGDILTFTGPGLDYDPVAQKLIGWIGDARVFEIDPVAKSITEVALIATGALSPPANGVFGRWVYSPAYSAFVGIPRANAPLSVYKVR